MKRYNQYITIYIVLPALIALLSTSCTKKLDSAADNPNVPPNVTPGVLLTAAQGDLAYTVGGDIARYTGIFMQYINGNGGGRQPDAWQRYSFTASDFNPAWANTFAGYLKNLTLLKQQSDSLGYVIYGGISRCLLAYGLIQSTDLWNNIPYSQAFQGSGNLTPQFTAQSSIYDTAFSLLNQALTLFTQTDVLPLPYSNDIIFGPSNPQTSGSSEVASWTNFAHALKARAYLHLAKKDASNYAKALTEITSSNYSSGANDARFYFFNTSTGSAPMNQYLNSRGDIVFGPTYSAISASFNDNARKALFDFSDAPDGVGPYFVANQALPLLTNVEVQFMKAECLLQTGAPDAQVRAAYLAGIQQSFTDLGVASSYAAYVAQPSVNPSGNVTLTNIITQKYLAMYFDPETFNDWRRTGLPALTPNVTTAQIPRRFLYPQTELDYNSSNTPTGVGLSDKVWWDQ